ncbi:MAG: response regulator [Pseudomonadota bacterium]
MSNENDGVMGTQRAAEALGVSVRTVQLWVENGTLKAWKTPGKHRRILESSVEALLAERSGEPTDVSDSGPDLLVVEDEVAMQTYYEAMIELIRPDVRIRFAANGFDALVEFGRKEPALVLLDIDMPGMDGIELLQALERKGETGAKVVVVTGLSATEIESRGGLPSGVPMMAKPVSVDALESILTASFGVDTEGA